MPVDAPCLSFQLARGTHAWRVPDASAPSPQVRHTGSPVPPQLTQPLICMPAHVAGEAASAPDKAALLLLSPSITPTLAPPHLACLACIAAPGARGCWGGGERPPTALSAAPAAASPAPAAPRAALDRLQGDDEGGTPAAGVAGRGSMEPGPVLLSAAGWAHNAGACWGAHLGALQASAAERSSAVCNAAGPAGGDMLPGESLNGDDPPLGWLLDMAAELASAIASCRDSAGRAGAQESSLPVANAHGSAATPRIGAATAAKRAYSGGVCVGSSALVALHSCLCAVLLLHGRVGERGELAWGQGGCREGPKLAGASGKPCQRVA